MAQKLKVTYNDGTETTVTASPKAQVMAERFMRQQGGFTNSTAIEASVRLAYEASKPGIGNVGYEEWLDQVADVDGICADCGKPFGGDPDMHVCAAEQGSGADESADPTHEAPLSIRSSD